MRHVWRGVKGTVRVPVEVEFESSGWSDPGYVGGPPEDCREAEREETRAVTRVLAGGEELPAELTRLLAPHLAAAIEDEEVLGA